MCECSGLGPFRGEDQYDDRHKHQGDKDGDHADTAGGGGSGTATN